MKEIGRVKYNMYAIKFNIDIGGNNKSFHH